MPQLCYLKAVSTLHDLTLKGLIQYKSQLYGYGDTIAQNIFKRLKESTKKFCQKFKLSIFKILYI